MPTFNPLSTYSASSTMRESHAVYYDPIITPHYITVVGTIAYTVTYHTSFPIIVQSLSSNQYTDGSHVKYASHGMFNAVSYYLNSNICESIHLKQSTILTFVFITIN